MAILLLLPGKLNFRLVKTPLILLALLASLIALQLVPLPPEIWMMLPGHARFSDAAIVASMPQPWRPWSITPDRTLNSLAALAVPAAALVGLASLSRERLFLLLPLLLAAAFIGAVVGMAQMAGGPNSSFYLYSITNEGAAVGLFANRNHQAALLACTLSMLALWSVLPQDYRTASVRSWIAVTLGIFILPMILVTGSRAGLVLGGTALMLIYFQLRGAKPTFALPRLGKWRRLLVFLPWVVGVMVVAAAVFLSRAAALQRILGEDGLNDVRISALPVYVQMAKDFFPFGSGFGSFDPLYRVYEPVDQLSPAYLNHAHNDLLELVITGGLPALLLLLALLTWWGRQSVRAFRSVASGSRSVGFARLGSIVMGLLFAASLTDYPLRTPLMTVIFVIACAWLSQLNGKRSASTSPHHDDV